jgi:hypothetical protein
MNFPVKNNTVFVYLNLKKIAISIRRYIEETEAL